MSLFFIQASTLTNIANAIRSATGTTGPIAVSSFASAVANVPSGGGSGTNLSSADRYTLYNYNSDSYSNVYITPPDTDCSRIGDIKTAFGNAGASINSVFFAELLRINDGPFMTDNYIQYIEAPNCNTIGESAFANCYSLTSVSFPACTYIESSAFQNCSALISASFSVCTSIGYYAFCGCSALTSTSFPACTSIGGGAFSDCYSLTSVSFSVCTSIGEYAFYSCSALTSISFPACANIRSYAFEYCSTLTSVSFPACTSVEEYAFANCSELTSAWFKAEAGFSDNVFYSILTSDRTDNFELYLSGSSVGYATSNLFGSYNDLMKVGQAASSSANGSEAPSGTSDIMPIKNLSIFVPASLVSDFQENWGEGYFSANIFAWPT